MVFPTASVSAAFSAWGTEAQGILLQMMRSQAFRERAAVRLFEQGLPFAPDERARLRLVHDGAEEQRHYDAIALLWAACQSADRAELDTWVDARVARDDVPSPTSWLDIAFAQFLYDRAGLWQLREAAQLPFEPYAKLAAAVVAEEDGHSCHGEEALVSLRTTTAPTLWAEAFHRWLRIALLSFGRASSPRARRAQELGLRRRAPDAVRDDFLREIAPMVHRLALPWPRPSSLALDLPATTFAAFG